MTLEKLLEDETLQDLTIINQKADLGRDVSSVESTETPDVVAYVSVNSLIITTAMVYKDDQERLCELILRLNAMPCAGLAIKLGRFVDKLDRKVIETADSVGFPLIRIPMCRTLGNVYHNLLSIIWESENKDLIDALNIQKKFYNLIIHGISLKRLVKVLGTTIRKHVLIIDRFGEICGCCQTSEYENRIAVRLIRKIDKDNSEYIRKAVPASGKEKETVVQIYPIKSVNRNSHFLLIFDREGNSAISAFVMEEIILILGMHFYKNLFMYLNEMRTRDSFLQIMLKDSKEEHWSHQQILALGQEHGLRHSDYYRVVLGRFRMVEVQKFHMVQLLRREEEYILVYDYLKRKIKTCFQENIVVLPDISHWRYMLLIQEKSVDLRRALDEICHTVESSFQKQMVFSYGNDAYDMGTTTASYWEAAEIFQNLEDCPEEYIFTYKPQNIMELLKGISGVRIDEVCRRMLKELAFPADEMNRELKKTLKAYLDCHCSIMETANRLYLHRNTVRYRIKKCEEIMGNDLSDSQYCFQLQLCLILSDM